MEYRRTPLPVVLTHIPNLLTMLRIGASPILILLLDQNRYGAAFVVLLLAGVSDGLDGYIAKRFGFVTRLGAILDPLADKMLIVSAFVMLLILNDIPFWLFLVVAFRDLVIIGGYIVLALLNGDVQMRPSPISRLNTVLQIVLLGTILVDRAGWLTLTLALHLLYGAVLVTTVWSGAQYVWIWGIRRDPVPVTRDPDDHP